MRALVLGGADCVWDDLARAQRLGEFDAVVAVNDAGVEYAGELAIWATLHPEKMARWVEQRASNGYPPARIIAAHKGNTKEKNGETPPPVTYVTEYMWPGMAASGSSGFFAVKVAIEHGYDRIVLCGVPMTSEGRHFFDKRAWGEVGGFKEAWKQALAYYADMTRSMSGWTKELLGEPTPEWLVGATPPAASGRDAQPTEQREAG